MTTREKIGATLCGIGILLVIGTVGAMDCGTVSITQGFIQAAAGVAVTLIGAKIGDIYS